MLRIPGGTFVMGTEEGIGLEKPAHKVTLDPYCIDQFEVTVDDYKLCSDRGDCRRAGLTNKSANIAPTELAAFDALCNARDATVRAHHPVNCIDWEQAAQYCRTHDARLPTEAEWELAARGTDGRTYPWGDDPPTPERLNACGAECVAWGRTHSIAEQPMYTADDGWPSTAPIGSFPAGHSPYGLQDMAGNVWEWVADRYGAYDAREATNPRGPATGEERVVRGGSWNGAQPAWIRPTFRFHAPASNRTYGIGFRCAR
jgi:formylglycine-generating enzyme required for sulfatase activity